MRIDGHDLMSINDRADLPSNHKCPVEYFCEFGENMTETVPAL